MVKVELLTMTHQKLWRFRPVRAADWLATCDHSAR